MLFFTAASARRRAFRPPEQGVEETPDLRPTERMVELAYEMRDLLTPATSTLSAARSIAAGR
jgi:hypothetical protein